MTKHTPVCLACLESKSDSTAKRTLLCPTHAAAPELLEAAKWVLGVLSPKLTHKEGKMLSAYQSLDKAIAKAEGQ